MITPYSVVEKEKDKELRLIGYMEITQPLDVGSFLNDNLSLSIKPVTDIKIIEGKTKILTRQSPNRELISSGIDKDINEMLAMVCSAIAYQLREMKIESPVTLLFTYRRQFWDWEIICQAYV